MLAAWLQSLAKSLVPLIGRQELRCQANFRLIQRKPVVGPRRRCTPGAQCGKISVQTPCRVPLTSRIRAVYCEVTCNCDC
jgi:hypothetical protein